MRRAYFSARRAGLAGFTLMETLVMLMLVSLATSLMFQMLDSYRVAQERVAAQAGQQDRSSLFESWFIDEVHGLSAVPGQPFKGSRSEFEGATLNPLFGSPGAPSSIRWRLNRSAEGGAIEYWEDGRERWTLPLRDFADARFVFFAKDGSQYDQWPPSKGLQEGLPDAIAFIRGEPQAERMRLAAVRGPLVPTQVLFEREEE